MELDIALGVWLTGCVLLGNLCARLSNREMASSSGIIDLEQAADMQLGLWEAKPKSGYKRSPVSALAVGVRMLVIMHTLPCLVRLIAWPVVCF